LTGMVSGSVASVRVDYIGTMSAIGYSAFPETNKERGDTPLGIPDVS